MPHSAPSVHFPESPLVQDVMQPSPLCVTSSTTLEKAQRSLENYDVRHLAVVDGTRLVGVVSEGDIQGALGGANPDERQERLQWPCSRVASNDVVTASPDTPLGVAIDRLVHQRIGVLPVVEGERLVGILSTVDVLAFFRKALPE